MDPSIGIRYGPIMHKLVAQPRKAMHPRAVTRRDHTGSTAKKSLFRPDPPGSTAVLLALSLLTETEPAVSVCLLIISSKWWAPSVYSSH
jgi:hypothetical protein